jgi:hypothetical protein
VDDPRRYGLSPDVERPGNRGGSVCMITASARRVLYPSSPAIVDTSLSAAQRGNVGCGSAQTRPAPHFARWPTFFRHDHEVRHQKYLQG